MNRQEGQRKPAAFHIDDPRISEMEMQPADDASEEKSQADDSGAQSDDLYRGFHNSAAGKLLRFRLVGWGTVFWASLGGLISIGISLWITNFIAGLFANGGWLGYVALVLAILAVFAAFMIALREMLGFFRLGRVATIRLKAEGALADMDLRGAKTVAARIERLFADRPELKWGKARLAEHRGEILDANETLILTERELLSPLDREARRQVSASTKRVMLVTAVSPLAIIDVVFVAVENLSMLRRLATLYGGRPGFLGSIRLGRLVLGHLALTGGVALGDDVIQQLVGHGLTAKVSTRLGEGIINGAFTGRIGISAIEVCRPLPFIEAKRPRLRDFIAELRKSYRSSGN